MIDELIVPLFVRFDTFRVPLPWKDRVPLLLRVDTLRVPLPSKARVPPIVPLPLTVRLVTLAEAATSAGRFRVVKVPLVGMLPEAMLKLPPMATPLESRISVCEFCEPP